MTVSTIVRAVALLMLAALALVTGPAHADDDTAKPAADRCVNGNACYHFLRAPVSAPDPCFCPLCSDDHQHAGDTAPDGWNRRCWDRRGMPCFLKRHAASWQLSCSECLADTECCKEPFPARCPKCGDDKGPGPWRKDAEKLVAERLAVEKRHWDKSEPIVVVGRHFYVVTDIRSVKVITPHDGERVLSGHEYAHVLVMRAEQARRDFESAFGMPGISGQVGVFVPERESTGRKIRSDYFRNPSVPFVYSAYGSSSESAISEGFCMNGVCIPFQRVGDDAGMHEALRQFIAQIFFTTWIVTSGELRTTPPWAFAGIGFWVGKSPTALANEVYWLEGEDNVVTASGKHWAKEVADTAKKHGFRPIEEILAATTLAKLTAPDFKQIWGWFDVAMKDAPKEWAALLGELRRGTEVHAAFKKTLGWTPDEFQTRFQERLAGLRRTLKDGTDVAESSAPLAAEKDPEKVAARIRAVGVPKDVAIVKELLDLCARDGDLVRETAVLVLSRIKDAEPREPLWRYGAIHADAKVRATSLRVIRLLRVTESRAVVHAALADPSWFVRAEAFLAAAAIKDFDAQAAMREALSGGDAKLRIAACDALRSMGKDANPICVAPLAKCLDHEAWQVRVAAADALAVVGTLDAVDSLVRHLETETARVADAYRDALIATGRHLAA
ncbi:MAG: HEAT repeat domain-containing protein, partial [Planctomycetes bacterium]|nr:HEAT repeat domain-containing protein [Planctomycetota bacterium]